jgi:hypothetical protein
MSSLDFSRLVRAARPLRACARWRRAERYGTLHSRSQTHEIAANLFARRVHISTIRDGKLARLDMYQTKEQALEAAGLSE